MPDHKTVTFDASQWQLVTYDEIALPHHRFVNAETVAIPVMWC